MDKATEEIMRVANMSEKDRDAYFMALPPDKTSTLLVEDLQKKPQSETRDKLIERAKGYYYDDFKSVATTDICPKITLDRDLKEAGFHDLAYNNRNGRYD